MDSLTLKKAIRVGFRLTWRAGMAAILAGQVGARFGHLGIPYSSSIAAPLTIAEVATPASGKCLARTFPAFIEAFAESAAIQRQYTRIPLKYGHLDATLIGTPKEDVAFSTRAINSFEALPSFDSKDGGRIFPGKTIKKQKGLEVTVNADREHGGKAPIAIVFLPDACVHVEYRFESANNCWILVEIDDRST